MVRKDKLVADHTRDKLIADRAFKGIGGPSEHLQPTMMIDELGVPHAFCLSKFHHLCLRLSCVPDGH